jgi:hypothetical protein
LSLFHVRKILPVLSFSTIYSCSSTILGKDMFPYWVTLAKIVENQAGGRAQVLEEA